jgi:hypothetical protein
MRIMRTIFSRKNYAKTNRTKTDTGRLVENTKMIELTILKELGKLAL